ncbi:MAG: hypothetical protein PUF98_08415, partial [Oscillibacter sp.]|nr:hypothetical protein [Oscillibacter sp.]
MADADFVVFSNYCLIGTRQTAFCFCRIVKHIGQRTRQEIASGEASLESCWNDDYGQKAAYQSLQGNKSSGK